MSNNAHFTDGLGLRFELVNQGLVAYVKNITPPGVEGGDPINTTTTDNTSFESQAPRTLKMKTAINAEVTYDKNDKDAWEAAVDQSDDVLVHYPDDSSDLDAGWLGSFLANQTTFNEQPTAQVIVHYYNEGDPS